MLLCTMYQYIMIQAKMAEMKNINVSLINTWTLNFPGGPVVKTPHFHCRGHRFNP